MTLTFPRTREPSPGKWRLATSSDGAAPAVLLSCPVCGNEKQVLASFVAAGGKICRPVRCPTKGCFFVDEIVLHGWGDLRNA